MINVTFLLFRTTLKHKKQKSIFEISIFRYRYFVIDNFNKILIFPRFVIDIRQISITIDGVPVNARLNDTRAEYET